MMISASHGRQVSDYQTKSTGVVLACRAAVNTHLWDFCTIIERRRLRSLQQSPSKRAVRCDPTSRRAREGGFCCSGGPLPARKRIIHKTHHDVAAQLIFDLRTLREHSRCHLSR
jgi:hypothetical protein